MTGRPEVNGEFENIQPGERAMPLPPARRRRSGLYVLLALLAVGGGAASYAWLHGDHLSALVLALDRQDEAAPAANVQELEGLSELKASQQQLQETLQSIGQGMKAQQTQLKQMSDQLADLAAEVEALKTASPPAPVPPPVAAIATPVRPVAVAARRSSVKPKPSKPAGPVSLGGAPLVMTPGAGDRAASRDE